MVDAFAALHADCAPLGARLFTLTVHDPKARLFRRAYSSHPEDYPVSGTKPMGDDAWTRHVVDGGQSFIANTTAEFAPLFPDHAQINALGCHAALNIPVFDGAGAVVGTVNILDAEGHFTPARVAAFEALVARHRPALLAQIAAMDLIGG
ncbi:GAF domain-containing protein [Albidovulum sediminicola]|uniref:GAF domain-containing protein n=1 Tax=Albidovulum sediminicola TaxID=2984331 RepID=A0ABT2YYV7_9RHOB|nr:GAF domain-containing protein [Defluviimonas sp. WL0075]MCV2863947.1 GAF domain-containing protein [Defluviimonas sp. WL0075]